MKEGIFIMVDGIDGSGKSTVVSVWKEMLLANKREIFSLKDFWETHHRHPRFDEIPRTTFALFSGEPTTVWVGAAIREELVRAENHAYSPRAIAEAFALDRQILYARVLLPALAYGIHVIQDRGVSSSLCYQSVHAALSLQDIAAIEGNAYALSHAPNVLLLMDAPPEVCMARLATRQDKQDHALFEELALLKQFDQCFKSDAFVTQFTSRGTRVERFPAAQDIAILKPQLRERLAQYLSLSL